MKKQKMSNRKLRRIALVGVALLTCLAITISVGMGANADKLSDLYGRGKRMVVQLGNTAGMDAKYYPQLYASSEASREAGVATSKQISNEGTVLLKNNGLLPLNPEDTTLTPFGLRYSLPYYGGKGSSAISVHEENVTSPEKGIRMSFAKINTFVEDTLFQAAASNTILEDNPNILAARPAINSMDEHVLYEFNPAVYTGTETSCAGTVGVVFIGRQTGEQFDASTFSYDDGTPHMLAPTLAELATISFAKANCKDVVVVIASSTPMELSSLQDDTGINAILWVGGAGSSGYISLGEIMAGKVVPSGKTTSIYPVNFKLDPTFANQDNGTDSFVYSNAFTTMVSNHSWEENAKTPFHEYEEGVYLGYKYYETAFEDAQLPDYYNRKNGVLYPFGYGLSYTNFSQEITQFSDIDGNITLTVRVKNLGNQYAGKEVVQVYFTPPYTELDQQLQIEKPAVSLIAFEKTASIEPGKYQDIILHFPKEDMASYCYTKENNDGTFGSYMLEQGSYTISIRNNSHEVADSRTTEIAKTIWYDDASPRQTEQTAQTQFFPSASQTAKNRFEELNQYMNDAATSGAAILSRSNWGATQPTAPEKKDRVASDVVVQWIKEADTTKFNHETDETLGNTPTSALYKENLPPSRSGGDLVLADLRGKPYNDPMWDMMLDQINYDNPSEISRLLWEGAYKTGALESIGKPASAEYDGPQGITMTDLSGYNWIEGTCAYPSAPVMAATWNKTLLYDFGYTIGQEALLRGISGLYAPGLNLNRSPFGGRASEYFSEDPLLSGMLGAQVISGGGDAGIYCAVKHFVLIDTEAHRNAHTAVWLTEQALREVYLRPFEIALKTATKTIRYIAQEDGSLKTKTMRAGDFIMAGDCAVGPLWAAANPALLTGIVREEWGFEGFIISDMHLLSNANQINRMLRSGCDVLMSTESVADLSSVDLSSPTGRHRVREAIKNVCYTQANSALLQNVAPGSVVRQMPPKWFIWLLILNSIIALVDVTAFGWLALRTWDEKKHPENYED